MDRLNELLVDVIMTGGLIKPQAYNEDPPYGLHSGFWAPYETTDAGYKEFGGTYLQPFDLLSYLMVESHDRGWHMKEEEQRRILDATGFILIGTKNPPGQKRKTYHSLLFEGKEDDIDEAWNNVQYAARILSGESPAPAWYPRPSLNGLGVPGGAEDICGLGDLGARIKSKVPRARAMKTARKIVRDLKKQGAVRKVRGHDMIEIAGSIRRGKKSIGDIDIVYIPEWAYMDAAGIMPGMRQELVVDGIPVQIWTSDENEWPTMLLYATGSNFFNIMMRKRAEQFGYMLNQYGLWDRDDPTRLVTTDTELIFKILVMPRLKKVRGEWEPRLKRGQLDFWIPPEEREKENWHYHVPWGPKFERVGY